MAFEITKLIANSGAPIQYSEKWVRTVRDHIPFFKTSQGTQLVEVSPLMGHVNKNNVSGLLHDLKIPYDVHYLLTIINEWDLLEDLDTIAVVLVPSDEDLARLRKLLPAT